MTFKVPAAVYFFSLHAPRQGKLGDYESSVAHFEEALLQASILRDEPAREAIQKVIRFTIGLLFPFYCFIP